MDDRPNPPDRDDAVTERAASMDSRPAEPSRGAGRAINATFSRNRPERGAPGPDAAGPGRDAGGATDPRPAPHPTPEEEFQGAGYATRDRDDADPRDGAEERLGRDEATGAEDEHLGSEGQGGRPGLGGPPAPDLGAGGEAVEALLTPPGGDDLGGDRDADPNLNGGHGLRMLAPEEGDRPIEEEDTEDSLIGHDHETKAAWNRERIAHLREMEEDGAGVATSGQMGAGGAVLGGALEGWEGGMASPSVEMGDDRLDGELEEEEEILGDLRLGDAGDVLDDESINDPDNAPFLPEHRDLPEDDLSIEEKLLATPGEDILSSGPEIGVAEDLEMEDLNQTDNIEEAWEGARLDMDDAMDGNERRGGVEDD